MANLDGKQILMVVGQKNYNEEEFEYLRNSLENEGADICVASNSLEKALGRLSGYIAPDFSVSEVNAEDFDAVVVVGGYGAKVFLWDDQQTLSMLGKFSNAGKVVAAISTGPIALANAGVLKNKKATVYPDYDCALIMEDQGADYIHKNVVVDDNVITASHSRFKDQFAASIIEKLKG